MNKFRPQSCEGDHGEGGDQVEEASAGKGPTPAHPAQAVIRGSAGFNRHRDLIVALLREPGIASLLFRSLFR